MLYRAFFAALTMLAAGTASSSDRPALTVYTYGSFTAEWGPGPLIEEAFESGCGCDLVWVSLDDAALLLARLRIEGEATRADVVLGLDTSLMAEARATGLFAPHRVDTAALRLPEPWTDDVFLPFDYGHFAVVYDSERLATPPSSLADLVDQDGPKLIIQDPRSSTPGLGLMLWMKEIYGKDAEDAWRRLQPRILTVTKGWSEAYALFLEGEAPMVLSYATSPAYHQMYEGTDRYRAAVFREGHFPQVEIAARVRSSPNPRLARRFLAFMLTPEFQEHIPARNIMRPVIDLGDRLPEAFRSLPLPRTLRTLSPEEIARSRSAWIDEWTDGLSR